MSFKSFLVKQAAKVVTKTLQKQAEKAVEYQEKIMHMLIKEGKNTVFGHDHGFEKIKDHNSFKAQVPIADYEDFKGYIERINAGEMNVLWKGRPKYYAKTSGTTSGTKYIPLTKESIPNHFGTARNAIFNYMSSTGNSDFLDGKMIFLSGSPEMDTKDDIMVGRLSGISNHMIPRWLKSNQLPSYETNCIEDWEQKLDKIVAETIKADMRLISGIPPWVQMYYERVLQVTGKKTILEVFPNLSMFVYGGVNFEPYRAQLESLVGGRIASVETYPASEGFIAFQDSQDEKGLLLNTNSGIFFEFIPVDEIFNENPTRIWLKDVKMGVNYVLIMNTNAGLWGYNIGDTVQFVSTNPYRIVVSGRVKHFISAFGEHVISKEVEEAILSVAATEGIRIVEFTVAPEVAPKDGGKPFHEWFVEFDNEPANLLEFAQKVDVAMQGQNIYYKDLIEGAILQTLKLRPMKKDAFREYMKSIGKLGGQNKVPRLANDRKIADELGKFVK